jgi:hypoxanthine phosphoribosyltransferase
MPMESNNVITIGQLKFKIYLDEEQIYLRVKEIANEINARFTEKPPLIIVLMNGACFFAADLLKKLTFLPMVHFIKASSYHEMESTGTVVFQQISDLNLQGQDVLVIEDIVDSGTTMHQFCKLLTDSKVNSMTIATLLYKPSKLKYDLKIDFVGFEISDEFVVGYGLDYNNLGRNLGAIYQLGEL